MISLAKAWQADHQLCMAVQGDTVIKLYYNSRLEMLGVEVQSGLASSPQGFRPAGRCALANFNGVLRSTHFDGVFRGFPVVPVETPPRSGP
jgi:hypothetical protein